MTDTDRLIHLIGTQEKTIVALDRKLEAALLKNVENATGNLNAARSDQKMREKYPVRYWVSDLMLRGME